jgi:hypothetical protein
MDDKEVPAIQPPSVTGTVKDKGISLGAAISKTIGPEGGTIASADGRVLLSIPAGALSSSTTISIEPITSTTPGGLGNAYRFSPDGQQFKKPATLSIIYEPDSLRSGQPEALVIAYQNAEGIWTAVKGVRVNDLQHTITTPIYHFSDWSAAESYYLEVDNTTLLYGESTMLRVVKSCPLQPIDEEVPMTDPVPVEKISNWTLVGDGLLLVLGNSASYTAPHSEPKANPVSISVKVQPSNSKSFLLLFARIKVTDIANEIVLNFNRKTYYFQKPEEVTAVFSDQSLVAGGGRENKDGKIGVAIITNGLQGTFPFGNIEKGSSSYLSVTTSASSGTKTYENGYLKCENGLLMLVYTVGRVTITRNTSIVVEGTFEGTLATEVDECDEKPEFESASGTFRFRKNK